MRWKTPVRSARLRSSSYGAAESSLTLAIWLRELLGRLLLLGGAVHAVLSDLDWQEGAGEVAVVEPSPLIAGWQRLKTARDLGRDRGEPGRMIAVGRERRRQNDAGGTLADPQRL